jgi:Putative auto-transporter adhesin, head GIN domain
MIDRVVTELDNRTLKMHIKNCNSGWFSWFGAYLYKPVVYVTVIDLYRISSSRFLGRVFFEEGIHTDMLVINTNGCGNIVGVVHVHTLLIEGEGSVNVELSGDAECSKVKMSGSSNIMAPTMRTMNTSIHISGSGKADVNASQKVVASISGSGNIRYTGEAQDVSTSISGSGKITRY